MTPEGKVKKECRAYLKSIGAYVFSPVQMGYGAATVDDLCCVKGYFVAFEYKRDPHAKATERQQRCLAAVRKSGGKAAIVCSVVEIKNAFDVWGLSALIPEPGEYQPE